MSAVVVKLARANAYDFIRAVCNDRQAALFMLGAQPGLLEARTLHMEETALHHLVIENKPAEVRFLIEQGADINCRDSSGITPLMSACMLEYYDMAKLLLHAGAQTDLVDDGMGYTALHFAVEKCNLTLVKLLLTSGADKNKSAPLDGTPIELARKKYLLLADMLENKDA